MAAWIADVTCAGWESPYNFTVASQLKGYTAIPV